MAIVNGYCTLPALKTFLAINDGDDDSDLEAAIEAASRQVDDFCGNGRRFWQDGSVVARSYFPTEMRRVWVDDFSTVTGLLVKVDQDDDGIFETSLTINTDFLVEPLNAAAEYPVQPYTAIRLLNRTLTGFVRLSSGRPTVQVTAQYGWTAVPRAVERATLMQARNIFKSAKTTFGTVMVDGYSSRIPALDIMMRSMLESLVRWTTVDDGT